MGSGVDAVSREKEEKLFAEKLDRLLAGEEIHIEGEIDKDLRTSLDFARKMKSLGVEPSAQFKANLKARLLQKLDEQEDRAEANRGWLARLIRQPVWQAVGVLVFMIVVGSALWGSGVFNPSRQGTIEPTLAAPAPNTALTMTAAPQAGVAPTITVPAATAPETTAPSIYAANMYLAASANTDKSAYQPGEAVNIHVEWQNVASQNLTIDEYPPILSIMDHSTGQAVFTFQAGKSARTLAPGEKADYVETWNQIDAKGRMVAPGEYSLELEEMYYLGKSVQVTLTRPVNFTIY
jgi:hypothetical protein